MSISLGPDQEAWLAAQIESGEFKSMDDAIRRLVEERITDRMIEADDLAWAKPYVAEALAAARRGKVISHDEYRARNTARLAALRSRG